VRGSGASCKNGCQGGAYWGRAKQAEEQVFHPISIDRVWVGPGVRGKKRLVLTLEVQSGLTQQGDATVPWLARLWNGTNPAPHDGREHSQPENAQSLVIDLNQTNAISAAALIKPERQRLVRIAGEIWVLIPTEQCQHAAPQNR
jgi:hypothetical protein